GQGGEGEEGWEGWGRLRRGGGGGRPGEPQDRRVPPIPKNWERWILDVQTSYEDLDAVTQDQLRRKRNRDLGVREAKRLYREASADLARLLGLGGGRRGGGRRGGAGPRRGPRGAPAPA